MDTLTLETARADMLPLAREDHNDTRRCFWLDSLTEAILAPDARSDQAERNQVRHRARAMHPLVGERPAAKLDDEVLRYEGPHAGKEFRIRFKGTPETAKLARDKFLTSRKDESGAWMDFQGTSGSGGIVTLYVGTDKNLEMQAIEQGAKRLANAIRAQDLDGLDDGHVSIDRRTGKVYVWHMSIWTSSLFSL